MSKEKTKRHGISYWKQRKNADRIQAWAAMGLSVRQIAENMNISRSTLYDWWDRDPDISDAFTRGRTEADENVENALFRKACGYSAEVKKVIKIKHTEYDENGRKIREWEEPKEVYELIHVPADSTAIKFWLTNRQPERWPHLPKPAETGGEERAVIEITRVKDPEKPGEGSVIETLAEVKE